MQRMMVGAMIAALATFALADPPTFDKPTLAGLRRQQHARLKVPTEAAEADVEVDVFDPLAGTVFESEDAAGVHPVHKPDVTYYRGHVAGDPGSQVFVAIGADSIRGFVARDGKVDHFSSDRDGKTRGHRLKEKAKPFVCGVQGQGKAHPKTPKRMPDEAQLTGALTADVIIETDHELWTHFGSDAGTAAYVADLIAAVSAIYARDVNVTLRVPLVHLWATTADPWSAMVIDQALDEVQAYWQSRSTPRRAAVHFVSAKDFGGGIAWVDTLCSSYGVGVSGVDGSFDLANPSRTWDVIVVAHELGHGFGSLHSHCFQPPLDHCFNQESGCYSGPVECSRGTLMSYCHICGGGGLANIDLAFGPPVSAVIRSGAEQAPCLTAGTVATTTLPPATVPTTTSTTSTLSTTTMTVTSTTGSTTLPPPSVTSTTTTSTTTTLCKVRLTRCTRSAECCSKRCRNRPKRGGWVCVRRY